MASCQLSRCASLITLALLTGASLGCGGDGRFAVSGAISYDGQPVTNGNIGFIPKDASTATTVGSEIVDGRYEIPDHEGPRQGAYEVIIYAERPSGRKIQADEGSAEMVDQMVQYIPAEYNDRTTLTVEIAGDRDDLDFKLEKPKPSRGRRR